MSPKLTQEISFNVKSSYMTTWFEPSISAYIQPSLYRLGFLLIRVYFEDLGRCFIHLRLERNISYLWLQPGFQSANVYSSLLFVLMRMREKSLNCILKLKSIIFSEQNQSRWQNLQQKNPLNSGLKKNLGSWFSFQKKLFCFQFFLQKSWLIENK